MVRIPAVQVKWLKQITQLESGSKHKKIRQFQKGRQKQESRSKKYIGIRRKQNKYFNTGTERGMPTLHPFGWAAVKSQAISTEQQGESAVNAVTIACQSIYSMN